MSKPWRSEWRPRVDFAEVADALDVRTDQIMAARNPASAEVWVLFTPTDEEPPRVFSATLRRGLDDVLRLDGDLTEHPGAWEEIVRSAEERLK